MVWIPVIATVTGFGSWMTLQVISHGRKTAVLKQRVDAQETCLEKMDTKLDQVIEDTTAIRVALGENPHAN